MQVVEGQRLTGSYADDALKRSRYDVSSYQKKTHASGARQAE